MEMPAVLLLFLLTTVDELEVVLIVARDYARRERRPIGKIVRGLRLGVEVRTADGCVGGQHGHGQMVDRIGGEIRLQYPCGVTGREEMENREIAGPQKEQRGDLRQIAERPVPDPEPGVVEGGNGPELQDAAPDSVRSGRFREKVRAGHCRS